MYDIHRRLKFSLRGPHIFGNLCNVGVVDVRRKRLVMVLIMRRKWGNRDDNTSDGGSGFEG